jgi:hypothetical protein
VNEVEERAWEVVRRAFEERTPKPRRAPSYRLVAGLAVVAIAAAAPAIASPPGQAVFEKVREAVGVQHAEPALFSLPSKGRLLVVSTRHGGVWLVKSDGFKRRLGSYEDAQWSPHGLFVVATTKTALLALDVETGVRWSLARRSPFWPRWEGTRIDTRIAYMTRSGLRVVGGDGRGDHLLDRRATAVPAAWDPRRLHTLAYDSGGAIVLRNADTGRLLWRTPLGMTPTTLVWAPDGSRLAAVSPHRVLVLDADGKVRRTVTVLTETFVDGAFQPGSHRLALSLRTATGSEVRVVDVDHPGRSRLLFAGPGAFGDIAWSPEGRWLLVGWPTADQWLFLRGSRVHAVSNIREQFPRHDQKAPFLQFDSRWCCPAAR